MPDLALAVSRLVHGDDGLVPAVDQTTGVCRTLRESSRGCLGPNGLYAMRERGGVLRLRLDETAVDADASRLLTELLPGRHVRLTVIDEGSGMSEETKVRLFEPFFTTKGHEGTGLGLSVVHGIVQEHGGAITVSSEVGRGTTMHVYLPVATPEVLANVATATAQPGAGARILFVDDDEAIVHTMRRALEWLGYTCAGYTDPQAALAQFRETPEAFVAVITDYSIPQMTGIELARAVHAIRPDIRVALSTGHDPAEAYRPGEIALHIRKPTPMPDLALAVSRLVHGEDGLAPAPVAYATATWLLALRAPPKRGTYRHFVYTPPALPHGAGRAAPAALSQVDPGNARRVAILLEHEQVCAVGSGEYASRDEG